MFDLQLSTFNLLENYHRVLYFKHILGNEKINYFHACSVNKLLFLAKDSNSTLPLPFQLVFCFTDGAVGVADLQLICFFQLLLMV